MSDDDKILVFRGATGQPIAVPGEIVAESERPYRAYQLHQQGHTWEKVAELEGYPNREAARNDVKRYLAEGTSLVEDFSRKQLLEMEVARLSALQSAAWGPAMAGSVAHINSVLSIVVTRAKLLRLDQDVRDDEDTVDGRTVVAPSDPSGFREALTRVPGVEDRRG